MAALSFDTLLARPQQRSDVISLLGPPNLRNLLVHPQASGYELRTCTHVTMTVGGSFKFKLLFGGIPGSYPQLDRAQRLCAHLLPCQWGWG